MGFYIFGHEGSGDHGNEDHLRGICSLLPHRPEIYSTCPGEDWQYGIGGLGGLYQTDSHICDPVRGDWAFQLKQPEGKSFFPRGVQQIYWGDTQNGSLRGLSRYRAVVVTEGRSRRRLTEAGLTNVVTAPEPAFLVRRQIRALEGAFRNDTVALCLTQPPAAGGLLYRSYRHLIRYILMETDLHIALIPYCVKKGQNDLLLFQALTAPYRDTGRIHHRRDGDSQQLRGDLSLCCCCVGGAGAVAAWGCGVPGLCLCATDRTMGLSQELLGSWQEGVCPWEQLSREDQLTCCFQRFLTQTDRHRSKLEAARQALC